MCILHICCIYSGTCFTTYPNKPPSEKLIYDFHFTWFISNVQTTHALLYFVQLIYLLEKFIVCKMLYFIANIYILLPLFHDRKNLLLLQGCGLPTNIGT